MVVVAIIAVSAGRKRQDDPVAFFQRGYFAARFFDDTDAFMPQDNGQRDGDKRVERRSIGMAYTTGDNPDKRFRCFWRRQFYFF